MNLIVRIIIFLYNFLFLPIISYIIFSNLIILIPILSFINLIAINIYFYLYFIMIINFNILAILSQINFLNFQIILIVMNTIFAKFCYYLLNLEFQFLFQRIQIQIIRNFLNLILNVQLKIFLTTYFLQAKLYFEFIFHLFILFNNCFSLLNFFLILYFLNLMKSICFNYFHFQFYLINIHHLIIYQYFLSKLTNLIFINMMFRNFIFLTIISHFISLNFIILIPILSFINIIAINIYFYLYFIIRKKKNL